MDDQVEHTPTPACSCDAPSEYWDEDAHAPEAWADGFNAALAHPAVRQWEAEHQALWAESAPTCKGDFQYGCPDCHVSALILRLRAAGTEETPT